MLDAEHKSQRNAKSGVDVGPLAKAAKVTREMARRYTEGTAIPDLNKMKVVADWLNVRLAWLRDGEGQKRKEVATAGVQQTTASYTDDARELALVWQALSTDTRTMVRDIVFILSLAERQFPWLRRGKPSGETYNEWERRQLRAFETMVKMHPEGTLRSQPRKKGEVDQ